VGSQSTDPDESLPVRNSKLRVYLLRFRNSAVSLISLKLKFPSGDGSSTDKTIQKPPFLVKTRGFRGGFQKPLPYGQIKLSASGNDHGDGPALMSHKQRTKHPHFLVYPSISWVFICPEFSGQITFRPSTQVSAFCIIVVSLKICGLLLLCNFIDIVYSEF
jgi:hypothetical protein